MRAIALLTTVVFLLLSSLPVDAGEGDAQDLASVPNPVREALMHARWDEALALLDELAGTRSEERDLWLYLAGVAHDQAGRGEDALAALMQLERGFPESAWVDKARFLRAEIHRSRGEIQQAEALYEQAVGRLRSPERQGELAQIYLRFADEASTPPDAPDPQSSLDLDRAYSLYAKVLGLDAPTTLRDRALFRMAICMREKGDHGAAAVHFQTYLDDLEEPQRLWEARALLGRAELAAGQAVQARRTFEDLAADLTAAIASGEAAEELREEVGDARYDLARSWGGGGDAGKLAIAAYRRFLEEFPDHEKGTPAAFAIAVIERDLGLLDDAVTSFQAVTQRAAPATEEREVLEEHERMVREALYHKGSAQQNRGHYQEAIATFETYVSRYPSGPEWAAAQRGIVDSRFLIGAEHAQEERFEEARQAWRDFLELFPSTGAPPGSKRTSEGSTSKRPRRSVARIPRRRWLRSCARRSTSGRGSSAATLAARRPPAPSSAPR